MSIQHSNQKYYFYCDYMKIIEELLKSKNLLSTATGESVNDYIKKAVDERMERDNA